MAKHGLTEDQRQRLIAEMVRKGARLPTIEECEHHAQGWPYNQAEIGEIMRAMLAFGENAVRSDSADDMPDIPDFLRRTG